MISILKYILVPISRKILFVILFTLALFCCSTSSVRADNKNAVVYIVHSYSYTNICGRPQLEGVLKGFYEGGYVDGKNLNVIQATLLSKKVNTTRQELEEVSKKILSHIKKVHPKLVIVLDDNAFNYIALKLLNTDIPVVFSGINKSPENYNKQKHWLDSRERPGHNITGVFEKLHIKKSFCIQKKIQPELHKIEIISDYSPTGKAIQEQIKAELKGKACGVEWNIIVVKNWEEYKQEILKFNKKKTIGALYMASTKLNDSNGNIYSTSDIVKWTVANCVKPGIPINYYFSRLGMFGGAGVDFTYMGYQAGKMGAKILSGKPVAEIPIEDASRFSLVFNMKRVKQLKIDLPAELVLAAEYIYQ